MEIVTAIMVDGGFYKKQARKLFGDKSAKDRASELVQYCRRHLVNKKDSKEEYRLYRIFYYDCYPSDKNIYNPLTKKTVSLKKSSLYKWTNEFINELSCQRKLALRMGELLESQAKYQLRPDILKK